MYLFVVKGSNTIKEKIGIKGPDIICRIVTSNEQTNKYIRKIAIILGVSITLFSIILSKLSLFSKIGYGIVSISLNNSNS